MKKKKMKKKVKISKFERLIYTLAVTLVLMAPISIVFSKASQQKKNDSLAMAIDELASLTKIQQVAQSEGLSYNNANIKVVR